MAEFKFRNTKKTLEIEGKQYIIDIGNVDTLKAWAAQVAEISDKLQADSDQTTIDRMVDMEQKVVNLIIGDWERLWELCEHNVFAMLDLVTHLSEHLNAWIKERQDQYGV